MLYYKGKTNLNLVPTAGLEPARPIKPRDFKSLVSTIPPRGQEPDFQTCRYFKFQPPNSIKFTSIGCFFSSRAQHFPLHHTSKNHSFLSSQALSPVTCENDKLNNRAIKVTARGKVPFMLEMTINAATPLK